VCLCVVCVYVCVCLCGVRVCGICGVCGVFVYLFVGPGCGVCVV